MLGNGMAKVMGTVSVYTKVREEKTNTYTAVLRCLGHDLMVHGSHPILGYPPGSTGATDYDSTHASLNQTQSCWHDLILQTLVFLACKPLFSRRYHLSLSSRCL